MGGTGFQDTVLHTATCNYSHVQVPRPVTSSFTWVANGTRKLFWGLIKCSGYVTSEENAQYNILKDISLGDTGGKAVYNELSIPASQRGSAHHQIHCSGAQTLSTDPTALEIPAPLKLAYL